MSRPDTTNHRMQCMEVWGGNQFVNSAVGLSGLDAWVFSKPHGPRPAVVEASAVAIPGGAPGDDPDASGDVGGGDVHYVSSCASGRITRLLVADVSGHGQSVHQVAIQLRTLMRRFVNYISPARFMSAMNDQFASLTEVGCFATAIVATYFAPTRTLTLCNAGHPPPLMYRGDTATWSLLQRDEPGGSAHAHAELPLGVASRTAYQPFALRLERGDMVLCYTDSLIEARGDSGRMLGTAGLLDVVRRLDTAEPHRIIPRLLEAIGGLAPGNLEHDDVTALLFTPNTQRVGWRDTLLAPIRVLREWVQRPAPLIGRARHA